MWLWREKGREFLLSPSRLRVEAAVQRRRRAAGGGRALRERGARLPAGGDPRGHDGGGGVRAGER